MFVSKCLNLQAVLGTRERSRDPYALPWLPLTSPNFMILPPAPLSPRLSMWSPHSPFLPGINQHPPATHPALSVVAAKVDYILRDACAPAPVLMPAEQM